MTETELSSDTPRISLHMAVFNSAKYLENAIKSILNQTFGQFQLLICDDGSTDSSLKIAGEFQDRDHRVRVVAGDHIGTAAIHG